MGKNLIKNIDVYRVFVVYLVIMKYQTESILNENVTVTDEQLMIELQQGKSSAFDDLVSRYHQDAIRLAYYYLSNWEDARDLSQDAFIKVYNQAHTFDPNQSFRPWFFKILVNHTLNFIKRKKKIRFLSIFEQNFKNDSGENTLIDFIREPNNNEKEFYTQQLVWNALNRLSPQHRNVMILHEIEGLKEQEIAEVLDCSIGTVKSRLHYARKKMKKILVKEMG